VSSSGSRLSYACLLALTKVLWVVSSARIHHRQVNIGERFRFCQKAAKNQDLIDPIEKVRIVVHLLYSL
jgi:hypothetical protein